MKTSIVLLLALCAFSCHCVSAGGGECMEQFKLVFKEMSKMYDDKTAPQCVTDLELAQFKCTGGEDEAKDKETMKTYWNWFKNQDKDTQEKIMACMKDMRNAAMDKLGDEISQECKDKMKEMRQKMMKPRE